MKMIPDKIRTLRELKGFSQEYMSEKLNLSVNSYGRLERGETQMTLKRLEEIAGVLEIEVEELLKFDSQSVFIHSVQQNQVVNFQGTVYYSEKEVYEKEIEALKNEIAHQKKIIELLEEQLKK